MKVQQEDTDLKPKVNNPEDIVKPATEETHSATGVDEFHDKYDGTGVKVGIIDTGIDPGHEAFTQYNDEGEIVSSKIKGVVDTVGEGDVWFQEGAKEGASYHCKMKAHTIQKASMLKMIHIISVR